MYRESLFNIRDLNPELAKKIEKLKMVASARKQLSKLERSVLSGIFLQTFQICKFLFISDMYLAVDLPQTYRP